MDAKHTFVMAYSGGKDSALAFDRCIRAGHRPFSLVTTYRPTAGNSWFHRLPAHLLQEVAAALDVPLRLIAVGEDDDYSERFKATLASEARRGATACAFGDIDIEDHRRWDAALCDAAAVAMMLPLWREDRLALAKECIDRGFTATITTVNTALLPPKFLGEPLSHAVLEAIAATGADPCGENGEYHTFVSDGPIFRHPVSFRWGAVETRDHYAWLPLL